MPNFYEEGLQALQQKNYNVAKLLLAQAIADDPCFLKSYLHLGRACYLSGDKKSAIYNLNAYITAMLNTAMLNSVYFVAYDVAHAFVTLGLCYEEDSGYAYAIAHYEKAIKAEPTYALAYYNLGLVYIKAGKLELKEEQLKKASELFDTALTYLKMALKIPHMPIYQPLFLQGMAEWYEEYIHVLKAKSSSYQKTTMIGQCFQLVNDYHAAAFEACIADETDVKNDAREERIRCLSRYGYYLLGEVQAYENAKNQYLQILELAPNHTDALTQVGVCLIEQGQYAEARSYFSQVSTASNTEQQQAYAKLYSAFTFRQEEDFLNAQKVLEEAKILAPDDKYILKEEKKLKKVHSFVTSPVELNRYAFHSTQSLDQENNLDRMASNLGVN